jgi:hypothetical protein
VDDKQQVFVALKMEVPGIGWGGHITDGSGKARIANIKDAETFREYVSDVGTAAIDHDLHSVRMTTLIAVTDQAHVSAVVW